MCVRSGILLCTINKFILKTDIYSVITFLLLGFYSAGGIYSATELHKVEYSTNITLKFRLNHEPCTFYNILKFNFLQL
jgi:hypothetical protein